MFGNGMNGKKIAKNANIPLMYYIIFNYMTAQIIKYIHKKTFVHDSTDYFSFVATLERL